MAMDERLLPTAEEVLGKIKDDGDFDNLRLKVIRKVKENEELRKSIISQVKESNVLKEESSEDMKPRELSDAIYQDLGRKIMGQISDEIWKVIRSNHDIRDDIKGTVESVFNKMMNPDADGGQDSNPSETNDAADALMAAPKRLSPPEGNAAQVDSPDRNQVLPPGFGSNHVRLDADDDPDLPPGFD